MKKILKWLLPLIALLIAGTAAVLLLLPGDTTPDQPAQGAYVTQPLFWNVDRMDYVGENARIRRATDGLYRAEFAVDGEQVTMYFPTKELMAEADALDVMGLYYDENHVVSRVLNVEEFTGGLGAYRLYVEEVTDETILCNTLANYRGLSLTLYLNDKTNFYLVDPDGGPLVGSAVTPTRDCVITAVLSHTGFVDTAYVELPFSASPVYYNVERKWDSTAAVSTREANLIGVYEILFSAGGEQMTFLCKDANLVHKIDEFATRVMHLTFDEEGYINGVSGAWNATGNYTNISWYYVTALEEGHFTTSRLVDGVLKEISAYPAADLQVYNVSSNAAVIGEKTTLQLGDRVHCLANKAGDVSVIYVVERPLDKPIYWNVERKYDAANQVSTRTPDGNGWYKILLAQGGEQMTLKTKNKAFVDKLDSYAAKCFGLDVEGDEITAVYGPATVKNGSTWGSWVDITSLDADGNVTAVKLENGQITGNFTGKLAADCKVYDCSSVAEFVGKATELRVDDRVHALMSPLGEITTVFVVNRAVNCKLYFNIGRQYDSVGKVTKRVADEEGYYHFTFAVEGKQVQLRTKSKSLATRIDAVSTCAMGLTVSGDIITNMYADSSVKGYTGGHKAAWYTLTAINGRTLTARNQNKTDTDYGRTFRGTMLSSAPIYNVSGAYMDYQGEKTTLQAGDKVMFMLNREGSINLIYVVTRTWDLPIYWNTQAMWDKEAGVSTRTPDSEGWYHFTMSLDGQQVALKTRDADIVATIDSRAVDCTGLLVEDGIIKKAVMPWNCKATDGGDFASWCTVTDIAEDGTITARKNAETVYTSAPAEGLQVFDVSKHAAVEGEVTDLRVGDLIHGLADANGKPVIIYVISRPAAVPMYFNLDRSYDSTTQSTKRTPDSEGYYHFQVAVDGRLETVKTADKAIADSIDSVATKAMGMKVEDGIVLATYPNGEVAGYTGGRKAAWYTVTALEGNTLTAENKNASDPDFGYIYTLTMTETCKVYNCSDAVYSHRGEVDTLKLNDQVLCLLNAEGQVCQVYIVNRSWDLPIYWNVEKLWDGSASTRTPDSEGWYHFHMSLNGEPVQVKTRDKTIVDTIDGRAVDCIGLAVEDGVIRKAVMPWKCAATIGGDFGSWTHVTALTDTTVTTTRINAGSDQGKVYTGSLENCKVYDVSSYATVEGEPATLRIGDLIHGLKDANGQPVIIYIISRQDAHTADHCICGGTLEANAAAQHGACTDAVWFPVGSADMWTNLTESGKLSASRRFKENTVNIYLTGDFTIPQKLEVAPGQVINICLNGHTLSSPASTRFTDICAGTLNLCDCAGGGKLLSDFHTAIYGYSAGVFNLYGGTVTTKAATSTKKWGLVYLGNDAVSSMGLSAAASHMRMYGGTLDASGLSLPVTDSAGGAIWAWASGSTVAIHGGTVKGANITATGSVKGGAIALTNSSARFTMTGGTVTGGRNPNGTGGNLYLAGSENTISGGTISGGSANQGGNLYCTGTVTINGSAAIDGGTSAGSGGNIYVYSGKVKLGGNATINGGVSGGTSSGGSVYLRWNSGASLEMSGGAIRGGTAGTTAGKGECGNLYVGLGCSLTMTGGTISGGTGTNGGNIGCFGTITMSGDARIENGAASSNGGNVSLYMDDTAQPRASLTMNGGAISGGTSGSNGGNIRLGKHCTVTINGGTVENGTATGNGGNIYMGVTNTTLNIHDGTITGGSAKLGGGVLVNASSLVNLSGNVQVNGNAVTDFWLDTNAKLTLAGELSKDSLIGVYMWSAKTFLTGLTEDLSGCFLCQNSGKQVVYQNGELAIG